MNRFIALPTLVLGMTLVSLSAHAYNNKPIAPPYKKCKATGRGRTLPHYPILKNAPAKILTAKIAI